MTILATSDAERKMLSDAGYADPAINYYLEKKYMGHIENADQISENVGSCGDTNHRLCRGNFSCDGSRRSGQGENY